MRLFSACLLLVSLCLASAGVLYPLPSDVGACCENSVCLNTTALFCVNLDSFDVGGDCTGDRVCGSCCDVNTTNYACGSIFNDSTWCPPDEFRTNFYCPIYYADASVDVTGTNHSASLWWGLPITGTHVSGYSVAYVGDINGDGNGDVAISGATSTDSNRGDISIVFMDGDGGKISTHPLAAATVFSGLFNANSFWGRGLIGIGDVDGDGVPDLAVGSQAAVGGTDGGHSGILTFLFMHSDGTVKSKYHYWAANSSIPESFVTYAETLGNSMCFLGDWTGDGHTHIALGNVAANNGTLYFARVFANGSLEVYGSIDRDSLPLAQGFNVTNPHFYGPQFGFSCTTPGDLNGDGIPDLVVGANADTDSSDPEGLKGVVWVLLMETATTVLKATSIGNKQIRGLELYAEFGRSVTAAGDLDQNGVPDIWVGATNTSPNVNDTLNTTGVVYAIFLRADGYPIGYEEFSNGSFSGFEVSDVESIGSSIAVVGDWYNTGTSVIIVGTLGASGSGDGVYTVEVTRTSRVCAHPLPPDRVVSTGVIVVICVVGGVFILAVIAGIVYTFV